LLIDTLISAWDIFDLLSEIFTVELAQAYLQAGFEEVGVINADNE
jgi:hypothetical protein